MPKETGYRHLAPEKFGAFSFGAICLKPGSAKFRVMPNKGRRISSPRHKVQNLSPDDGALARD